MSKKTGDKKLGRKPVDDKKRSRPKGREKRGAPPPETKEMTPEAPVVQPSSQIPAAGFPVSPAWFLVDLWEPYFFWAASMEIVKNTLGSSGWQGHLPR